MILTVTPQEIELLKDELDSNVLNCRLQDGYFSIQAAVYLEEDDELNEPYLELNGQDHAQYGGVEKVTFFPDRISIKLAASKLFDGKYQSIEIQPREGVTREIVDFFNNFLFLGSIASYSADFDPQKISPPVSNREDI